ncbi:MAG: acetate kinase, partial [Desulfobacterales bacterium]
MKVLVINSGSSSIKYQLFDMRDQSVLASGLLEQIGETESRLTHVTRNAQGEMEKTEKKQAVKNHQEGFELIGLVLGEFGALQD